ncbi:MAG: divalent metal cation transporter [Gammaproteobacteria bacterium]|nr:divalent metal cation transporter [Gammaproteobacteria bacterium]
MNNFLSRVGPGLMLAATAVGVSHLVYSTQAGGNYGFSLVWIIVLIVLLKYPAFHFAVDYASATGRSLVTGYSKISRIALAWLIVGFFVDMFIATGAVALVTAGLVISVFNLPFSGPQVAVGLMVISALILMNGQYAKAERIIKILVLLFSVLAVTATALALPLLGSDDRGVLAELTPDRSFALFVIAMAGWMPMPSNGAILFSKWICEKRKLVGDAFDRRGAMFDFRLGYGLSLVLALCFVIMGTAVLFESGRDVPTSAGGFATELFGIFTSVIGQWVYPVIAAAGIAVIWSTQVALMDALPRVTGRLFCIIVGKPDEADTHYGRFLLLQVVGVTIMLLFLMKNFTSFIYFATSMGFVASPAIAYYNYRAITSDEIPGEFRPKKAMVFWSWAGILCLTAFAVAFLWTNLG